MKPTPEKIDRAKKEIEREDRERRRRIESPERQGIIDETNRRCALPSEHPEHVHSMLCDGQDGRNSYCERLRRKLGQ